MTTDTLTFDVGSGLGTKENFSVPIVNDNLVENDETINIQATIQGTVGSFSGGGVNASMEIVIVDDDGESHIFEGRGKRNVYRKEGSG